MKSAATVFVTLVFAFCRSSAGRGAAAADFPTGHADAAVRGPSLAEIADVIESYGRPSSPLDVVFRELSDDDDADYGPAESRGKKPKPGMMAAAMTMSAGASMLMMKAVAAIKLFIIHSFLATKLGLIIGAYLLACKLMEMKNQPAKKVVKWVSAPAPHYEEHSSMAGHYPEAAPYEPPQVHEPQHQVQEPQQHHAPQQSASNQYGPPPPPVHQFMSSGDFGGGGGGDLQAHYSHVSPVTYRPMFNRNQAENQPKSAGQMR